jgi:hypothetical protein
MNYKNNNYNNNNLIKKLQKKDKESSIKKKLLENDKNKEKINIHKNINNINNINNNNNKNNISNSYSESKTKSFLNNHNNNNSKHLNNNNNLNYNNNNNINNHNNQNEIEKNFISEFLNIVEEMKNLYVYNNFDSNAINKFEYILKILENKEKNGYGNHSITYSSIHSIELILSLEKINKNKIYKQKIINLLNITEKYFKTCKKKLKEELENIPKKFLYYRLMIKYFSSAFNLKVYKNSDLKEYIKIQDNEKLKNFVNYYNKYSVSSAKLKNYMINFIKKIKNNNDNNKNIMNNNNNINDYEKTKIIKKIKNIISYLEMIPGMIEDDKLIIQCKNIFWFFNKCQKMK